MTDTARQISIGDIELSVVDVGDGPVILLVHGFPLDHSMWCAQLAGLSGDFRVIAPDLRGFGKSGCSAGSVTMSQFADDLANLLDGLDIDQPVTFCGLSMGGYIGWEMIRRHRQRLAAAIMADTRAACDAQDVARGRELMAAHVEHEGPAALVESLLPRLFSAYFLVQAPEVVAATRQVMMSTPVEGIGAALRGMAVRRDMRNHLPSMDLPVLLICGQHDQISPPVEMRQLATHMPFAQFELIADAGHMAPLENSRATNVAIRDFMQNL